jgi:hypothetical protein
MPGEELIRETTREVLKRPEFANAGETNWVEVIAGWLREWGRGFSRWADAHPALALVVAALLVVVLVALLTHIICVAFGDVWERRRRGGRTGQAKVRWEILEGAADNWRGALLKAREALAAGNHRLALWVSHRVLLGLLNEQEAIRFTKGKTNSDYLAECAPEHPWRPLLVGLTDHYERVVYGHRPADPSALAEALQGLEDCLPVLDAR